MTGDSPLRAGLVPADSSFLHEHVRHMERRNLRPGTIRQRVYVARRFARWIDPLDLAAAQHDDLERFLDRPGLAAESRATENSHLRSFYRWATIEGLIDVDPTVRLVRPKLRRRLPRPIPDGQLRRALDEAPDRVRPWLMLAAFAGLRAAEIAALCRDDVLDDRSPPVIVVTDGKGGHQRVVPMPRELVEDFRTWPKPARGWLFTYLDGRPGPVRANIVSAMANRYLHSIGINESIHCLRHWYGTRVYGMSSDLRLTQEVLGHRSPVTTAGYAAWSPQKAAGLLASLTVDSPDDLDPV